MKKAFTLIEVIVVVTIIGVLLTGSVVSYTSLSKSSRDARRKSDLEQIRSAMEMARSNDPLGLYPSGNDCGELAGNVSGYLPNFPTDPKPSNYNYGCFSSGTDYTIGAYLENPPAVICGSSDLAAGSCVEDCNYCVGPYGQK